MLIRHLDDIDEAFGCLRHKMRFNFAPLDDLNPMKALNSLQDSISIPCLVLNLVSLCMLGYNWVCPLRHLTPLMLSYNLGWPSRDINDP